MEYDEEEEDFVSELTARFDDMSVVSSSKPNRSYVPEQALVTTDWVKQAYPQYRFAIVPYNGFVCNEIDPALILSRARNELFVAQVMLLLGLMYNRIQTRVF